MSFTELPLKFDEINDLEIKQIKIVYRAIVLYFHPAEIHYLKDIVTI